MTEVWLRSLITDTPQEGYDLAMKLARKAVVLTQPDAKILETLRPSYASNADSLTLSSQVVATHFQTVAAANNYWKGSE